MLTFRKERNPTAPRLNKIFVFKTKQKKKTFCITMIRLIIKVFRNIFHNVLYTAGRQKEKQKKKNKIAEQTLMFGSFMLEN